MLPASLTNFPCHVSNDGLTWYCDMPGCGWSRAKDRKSLIVYHKNTHFPKYACPTCGDCFPQKARLDTHIRTYHTNERPFKCQHCEKDFVQVSNLNDHIKKHHARPERPLTPADPLTPVPALTPVQSL